MSGPPLRPNAPEERTPATAAAPADEPFAAPVITGGDAHRRPRPALDAVEEPESGAARVAALWLMTVLLAASTALWLALFSVAQATDQRVALPALERAIVAITDPDALIDVHLATLRSRTDAGEATLTLPGFPLRDAAVSAAQAVDASGAFDRDRFREALLSTSASLVYLRGADALLGTGATADGAALFSAAGVTRALLNTLTSARHGATVVWLWPLGAVSLALGALLLLLGRGLGRFVALGLAMLLAAALVLGATAALRAALSAVETGPAAGMLREIVDVARLVTDLPFRNALRLGAAGAAIAVPALVLRIALERPRRQAGSAGDPR